MTRRRTWIAASSLLFLGTAIACQPDGPPPQNGGGFTDGEPDYQIEAEVDLVEDMLRNGEIDYGRVLAAGYSDSMLTGRFDCGETTANGLPSSATSGPFVGSWMHSDTTATSQASALGIGCVSMAMTGTLTQPVTFTGAFTTVGRSVFARYATAAGVSALADSPVPGPGDVVAAAILIVGLAHVLYEATAIVFARAAVTECRCSYRSHGGEDPPASCGPRIRAPAPRGVDCGTFLRGIAPAECRRFIGHCTSVG